MAVCCHNLVKEYGHRASPGASTLQPRNSTPHLASQIKITYENKCFGFVSSGFIFLRDPETPNMHCHQNLPHPLFKTSLFETCNC